MSKKEETHLNALQKNKQNELNVLNGYVQVLKEYHKNLLEKSKNTDEDYLKSKLNLEVYELAIKIDSNVNLLNSKVKEYNNIYTKDKE
jgi:hypothetical protein|tara:strand:+ start:82 stop:345 length:264 start_codon:yes stop_codon:yes gene_type:complete